MFRMSPCGLAPDRTRADFAEALVELLGPAAAMLTSGTAASAHGHRESTRCRRAAV